MQIIAENSSCSIFHSRSFQKCRKDTENEHMMSTDDVHVLVIDVHDSFNQGRKRNRVRIQVRLWEFPTRKFHIEKFEKIVNADMSPHLLLLRTGEYLNIWKEVIYKYFKKK